MPSMRNIKRRIKSVRSTQQITKAMNLVAASKLQKAKTKLLTSRPFYEETSKAIKNIVSRTNSGSHIFLAEREIKNSAVILITGDRGLCGGYNVNVCKEARSLIRSFGGNEHLIVVGSKGRDYYRRRRKNIIRTYTGLTEMPLYEDAAEIGALVADMYKNSEIQQVYLVYTQFHSIMNQTPVSVRLLPVESAPADSTTDKKDKSSKTLMDYEPDESVLLDYIIPRYLNVFIYSAMIESAACEQGARMSSMDSATSNANDMIERLSLQYNRARQGAITQEINEIVSGANALE